MGMTSESWRRNLYAIFIAEFIVITSFSFVTPFMPLFLQELGSLAITDAAFWAGIATSASGLAMFLSAPIWGIIADRWGRKPMVLRAMFGAGAVLALTGLASNIYYVVGLRFAQGLLSGTVAAASAPGGIHDPQRQDALRHGASHGGGVPRYNPGSPTRRTGSR